VKAVVGGITILDEAAAPVVTVAALSVYLELPAAASCPNVATSAGKPRNHPDICSLSNGGAGTDARCLMESVSLEIGWGR
jgi:hypothetical protein